MKKSELFSAPPQSDKEQLFSAPPQSDKEQLLAEGSNCILIFKALSPNIQTSRNSLHVECRMHA